MEVLLDKNTHSFNFSQKECEIFQIFENCCRNLSRFIPLLNQDPKSMNDLFSTIEVIKEKILTNEKVFNQISVKHRTEKNKLEEEILTLQKEKIEQINLLDFEIKQNERKYKETFLQMSREKEDFQNENNSFKNKFSENANEIKLLKEDLNAEKQKNQKELQRCNNLEEKIKKMEKEHAEVLESNKIHSSKQNIQLLNQEKKLEESKGLKNQNQNLIFSIQEKEKNLNENFSIIKKLGEVKANLEEKNFSLNSIIQVLEKEKENQMHEYQIKLQELSDEKRSLIVIKEKDDQKIKDLNEKIKEIEEKNSSLGMQIDFVENRIKNLVTQNEELLNEKNSFCSRTNSLEEKNNILITENNLLNEKIKEIEEKNSSLGMKIDFIENRIKSLVTQNEELLNEKNYFCSRSNSLEEKNNILITENNLISNNLIELKKKYDEIRFSKLTNERILDEFSQDQEINMNEKKKRSNKIPEKKNNVLGSSLEDKNQEVDPNNMIILKSQSTQDGTRNEKIENNQKATIDISESEKESNKTDKIKESTENINENLNKNIINKNKSVELKENGEEISSNSSRVGSSNSLLFANPNPREYDFEDFDSNCSSDFGSKIRKEIDMKNIDFSIQSLPSEKEVEEEKEENTDDFKKNLSFKKVEVEAAPNVFMETKATQEKPSESHEKLNSKYNGMTKNLKGKSNAVFSKSHFANDLGEAQPNKASNDDNFLKNQIFEEKNVSSGMLDLLDNSNLLSSNPTYEGGKKKFVAEKANSINTGMYREDFKSKDSMEIYNNIENKTGNEYHFIEEKRLNNDEIPNDLPKYWASSNQNKQNSLKLNDSLKISQNVKNVQSGEL